MQCARWCCQGLKQLPGLLLLPQPRNEKRQRLPLLMQFPRPCTFWAPSSRSFPSLQVGLLIFLLLAWLILCQELLHVQRQKAVLQQRSSADWDSNAALRVARHMSSEHPSCASHTATLINQSSCMMTAAHSSAAWSEACAHSSGAPHVKTLALLQAVWWRL